MIVYAFYVNAYYFMRVANAQNFNADAFWINQKVLEAERKKYKYSSEVRKESSEKMPPFYTPHLAYDIIEIVHQTHLFASLSIMSAHV